MAINFDVLPTDKPVGSLLEPGFYKGKIANAEMKIPKSGGNPYLAITYDLTNFKGASKGKLWDNLFDIEKDLPRYKLGRFITALGLNIAGNFELKDLTKVVVGKSLIIDVGVDEKSDRPRNQVEVFKNEMYYPVREWAALMGVTAEVEDLPFDAEDGKETTVSGDDAY